MTIRMMIMNYRDNDKEQGETKADANIPECHFYETTLL
jgi:hypothetical protein